MQAQSVCSRFEVSDVINFRLEQVITPSWLLSEVVVSAVCLLTTTSSILGLRCCVAVDAQSLLGVINKCLSVEKGVEVVVDVEGFATTTSCMLEAAFSP